jgi:hypothetical protein
MWAGVAVSVLSVQLRFQAQTQLRQTFDDSAQIPKTQITLDQNSEELQ